MQEDAKHRDCSSSRDLWSRSLGDAICRPLLIAQGANVNAVDKHGISVILAAIWEGHTDCVKFLLSAVSRF